MNNETIDSTLAELTDLRSVGTVVFAQDVQIVISLFILKLNITLNFACVKNVVIGT